MATNSINFASTANMTMVTGVRKLSDANTIGMICEFSPDAFNNNGSFAIGAPRASSLANSFYFGAKGTTYRETTWDSFTTPSSRVMTAVANIVTPNMEVRANGSSVASSALSFGAVNFGTYSLYLFARNQASLWFNGQFYGAIICGASRSTVQIQQAEAYINNKSGKLY